MKESSYITTLIFGLLLINTASSGILEDAQKIVGGLFQKDKPKETDGVLQCISDRDHSQSINHVKTFCGA